MHKRLTITKFIFEQRDKTMSNNFIDNCLELKKATRNTHSSEIGKLVRPLLLQTPCSKPKKKNLKPPESPITWIINTLTSLINLEINQESTMAELGDTRRILTIKETHFYCNSLIRFFWKDCRIQIPRMWKFTFHMAMVMEFSVNKCHREIKRR